LDYRDAGSYGTAKQLIALCGIFYKNAQQHRDYGHLRNPLSGIHIDLPNAKEKEIFTLEELKSFSLDEPIAEAVCKVMILTGQRISEVLRMRWEDLDVTFSSRDNSIWKVGEKGEMKRKDSAHYLPMTAGVLDAISELTDNGSQWVFQSETDRNQPVRRPYVARHLKRKYPGFSPHCFRHSFATHTAEAEIDPYGISLVLHHSIPGMTNKVYIHGQQLERKRVVLEEWEKVINP